jgi:hypothetical protein
MHLLENTPEAEAARAKVWELVANFFTSSQIDRSNAELALTLWASGGYIGRIGYFC